MKKIKKLLTIALAAIISTSLKVDIIASHLATDIGIIAYDDTRDSIVIKPAPNPGGGLEVFPPSTPEFDPYSILFIYSALEVFLHSQMYQTGAISVRVETAASNVGYQRLMVSLNPFTDESDGIRIDSYRLMLNHQRRESTDPIVWNNAGRTAIFSNGQANFFSYLDRSLDVYAILNSRLEFDRNELFYSDISSELIWTRSPDSRILN